MGYKVTVLPEAEDELVEAALFYKQVPSELSGDLLNEFYGSILKISNNPQSFQTIRKEYRKINLRRFPYKVIFRIHLNEIFVVAFSHQKRKPYYWKNR
jgi:hypothetical protein